MKRSDVILNIIAERHRMSVAELISKSVKRYVVVARRDAIDMMKADGLTVARIAQAINLSRTTVREHLDPEWRVYRKTYRAEKYREKMAERGVIA